MRTKTEYTTHAGLNRPKQVRSGARAMPRGTDGSTLIDCAPAAATFPLRRSRPSHPAGRPTPNQYPPYVRNFRTCPAGLTASGAQSAHLTCGTSAPHPGSRAASMRASGAPPESLTTTIADTYRIRPTKEPRATPRKCAQLGAKRTQTRACHHETNRLNPNLRPSASICGQTPTRTCLTIPPPPGQMQPWRLEPQPGTEP